MLIDNDLPAVPVTRFPAAGNMLLALNKSGNHIYGGTVPRAEIDRRRARNKAARVARRHNRRR